MPQQARLGRMHLHAMHRTNTTLVGSECIGVQRGSSRFGGESAKYGPLYDAARAAHAPAINYKSMQLLWGARASKLWELVSAELLRPMAIGHPTT